MVIKLEKFGTILVSRPAGKESYLALQSMLKALGPAEPLEIDFSGVMVLTPSWADEFLTPLSGQFPGRVSLKNSDNPSVKATLQTLEKARQAGLDRG